METNQPNHSASGDLSRHSSFLTVLTSEIEKNINNSQFGVDSLAKAVGMSRSSLHRKLQRATGLSTSQFIREFRLKKALEILQSEDITASETAYRVGFSSATYFSTCFHNHYGYTPGEVSRVPESKDQESEYKSVKEGKRINVYFISALVVLILGTGSWFYYKSTNTNITTAANETTELHKSIAVLPFKNWTGDSSLEYVSDGMTDAVISRLTKVSALDKVIPFTTSLTYKNTNKNVEVIAKELGVENLLQGNLQLSGDQIRISLQLVNVPKNNHLWSKEYTFQWKNDEIFGIQSQVVEGIAEQMNAPISKEELVQIQKVATTNKQAYTYYLQAGFQKHKANSESYKIAKDLYEHSISLDSSFLEPYLGIADIWLSGGLVWGLYTEQEAWKNAKYYIQKALDIDPNSREIKDELYSGYFYFDWDFKKVEPYYHELRTNSFYDDTPVMDADYAIKTGRLKEAVEAMNRNILVDPSIGVFFFFKAEALMLQGKVDEAKKIMRESDPLYSDNWFYLRESAKTHYYLKQYDQSKLQLDRLLNRFPDYPPILMWLNAVYAQMDGDSTKTMKHLKELQNKYDQGASGSPAWFLAMYYFSIDQYDEAFSWLDLSYKRHEVEMTWLKQEPLLIPVRKDPRYLALYEKVGFTALDSAIVSMQSQ